MRAGRLNGRVSSAARATADLPMPSFSVRQITDLFARKGLSRSDMIVLSGMSSESVSAYDRTLRLDCQLKLLGGLGAHTIGRAHCDSVVERVSDPVLLSDAMAAELKEVCREGSAATVALNLDSTTPDRFDNEYYSNLINNRGLLHSDQVAMHVSLIQYVHHFIAQCFLFTFCINGSGQGMIVDVART